MDPGSAPALHIRCFGIPIEVQITFFVIVGLLGFGGSASDLAIWIGVAFVSILLHELGHAVVARAFGSPVRIVLYAFGGLTYHNAMSRGRSLAVTLAGPLSGLAAGGLVYAFSQSMAPLHGSVEVAVRYALWINIAWSLINLLPVLPLDGGQALRSAVHIVTGVDREALVRQISIGVAIGGGILAFRAGLTFTALFALFFVGDNFKALRDTKTNAHVQRLRSVDAADSAAVVAAADEVLADRPDPRLAAAAVDMKAWALLMARDLDGAQRALDERPADQPQRLDIQGAVYLARGQYDLGLGAIVESCRNGNVLSQEIAAEVAASGQVGQLTDRLLHVDPAFGHPAAFQLAVGLHVIGRYHEAIATAEALHALAPDDAGLVAYNIACSYARLGECDRALGWLATSVREGYHDAALLDGDEDLNALRADPRFSQIRTRLGAADA